MLVSPVRADFPGLAEVTYLNTGTHGIMPEPALRLYLEATTRYEQLGYYVHYDLEAERERARERLAALIGAPVSSLALTGNANDGVVTVAAGIAWRLGDEVLISDQEHPAIENPFGYLAQRGRITLRRFTLSGDPEETLSNIEAAISSRTRLIAVSYVSSQTGVRLPAARVAALAHANGIRFLLDGAQALGQIPIDVGDLGCDYFISNGHKWLFGPKGTGLLYVHPNRLDELEPANVGAGSLREGISPPELQPGATRFEFGTRALHLWAGMNAALDWWETNGYQATQSHMARLAARLKEQVAAHPRLTLLTPSEWERSSALTSFQVDGHPDAMALLWKFWERRVIVRAVPERQAIRISTAPFTNEEDLLRLMEAIDTL